MAQESSFIFVSSTMTTPVFTKLVNLIRRNRKDPVVGFENSREITEKIEQGLAGVVVVYLSGEADLRDCAGFLKSIQASAKKFPIRVVVVSRVDSKKFSTALLAWGASEYLHEKAATATIYFKISQLFTQIQKQLNGEGDNRLLKSDGTSDGRVSGRSSNVAVRTSNTIIAEDVWLISGSAPKKVGVQWVVESDGPDPDSGNWEFIGTSEGHQEQWVWKPCGEDGEPLPSKDGDGWNFTGNKPTYNAETKKWRFVGSQIDLTHKENGNKTGSKIKLDPEGGIMVAADNPAAEDKIEQSRKIGRIVKEKKDREAAQALAAENAAKELARAARGGSPDVSDKNTTAKGSGADELAGAQIASSKRQEKKDLGSIESDAKTDRQTDAENPSVQQKSNKSNDQAQRERAQGPAPKDSRTQQGTNGSSADNQIEQPAHTRENHIQEQSASLAMGSSAKPEIEGTQKNHESSTLEKKSQAPERASNNAKQASASELKKPVPIEDADDLTRPSRKKSESIRESNSSRPKIAESESTFSNQDVKTQTDARKPGERSAREREIGANNGQSKNSNSSRSSEKSGIGKESERSSSDRRDSSTDWQDESAEHNRPRTGEAAPVSGATKSIDLKATGHVGTRDANKKDPHDSDPTLSNWKDDGRRNSAQFKEGELTEEDEKLLKMYLFKKTVGKHRNSGELEGLARIASSEFGDSEGVWEPVGDKGWIFMTATMRSRDFAALQKGNNFSFVERQPGGVEPYYDGNSKTWLFPRNQTPAKAHVFKDLPKEYQDYLDQRGKEPEDLEAAMDDVIDRLERANDKTNQTFESFSDINMEAPSTSAGRTKSDKTTKKGPSHLGFFVKISDLVSKNRGRKEIYSAIAGYIKESTKADHVFLLEPEPNGDFKHVVRIAASTNESMIIGSPYDLSLTHFANAMEMNQDRVIAISEVKAVWVYPVLQKLPREKTLGVLMIQFAIANQEKILENRHFFDQLSKQLARMLAPKPGLAKAA